MKAVLGALAFMHQSSDNQLVLNNIFPYGSIDLYIFCDGSGGSNNDNGGWGFCVQSRFGKIIYEDFGAPDGLSTNNISEYRSVIAALEWAKGKTAGCITIKTDSKLVVEQVLGRWKCKKPHLQPLWTRTKELIVEVDAIIMWIPREENKRADELSREWQNHG